MLKTLATLVALGLGAGSALAAPPGEVTGDQMSASSTLTWGPVSGADRYNVYRGEVGWLARGAGAACHASGISSTSFATAANPGSGSGYFYLITAESILNGESTAGSQTGGSPRPLRGSCVRVMRNHVLDRIGFGWSEWTRDRIAALGTQAYLSEQLAPASIDETTNADLNTRRPPLVPPETVGELQALDLVNAVYARRQLEQHATLFWDNHFNTEYNKSNGFFNFYAACKPTQRLQAAKFHHDSQNDFRNLAFNGTFREILEASALGPAMINYLDTDNNVKQAPNENFARELLELHTMGVTGGYTQQDVVELARVFTGWNVCKKSDANALDPLAACLVITSGQFCTGSEPAGQWVTNFRTTQHDTGQKILFQGTPYQVIIPSTTSNPSAGINDAALALDAIVQHSSTPRYIAAKLLQRFVDETPSQAMIDAVVAVWNDAGNPHGVGDLREILRAVLTQQAFFDPDRVRAKIKTPFEHVASTLRTLRGRTDGSNTVASYLGLLQEPLHANPVPTGYSELGGDWLDSNNLLWRQNFGLALATSTGTNFGADVVGLLNANGVATAASPNNAPAIVDFLADLMFGGALTGAERQAAIDYLNTDDGGVPTVYTDARIRETAGFMLGYAQFNEQ